MNEVCIFCGSVIEPAKKKDAEKDADDNDDKDDIEDEENEEHNEKTEGTSENLQSGRKKQ